MTMPLDRITQAGRFNDEKGGSAKISADMVLVNSLGELQLNGQCYPKLPFVGAGLMLDYRLIDSVEHSALVLVENLAVMAALSRLQLPQALNEALFLYRGDIKDVSTQAASNAFKQLACPMKVVFADFDPAGLRIALTSHADFALFPAEPRWDEICNPNWQDLEGFEERWQNQYQDFGAFASNRDIPDWASKAFKIMGQHRQTRTQEHLIAHQVPLQLLPLQ
ncbi:DUF7281 domain-containing protein [Ferrimonas senticii]|uniref:DUF7281 domain-containing protein n=1 Tax=Ferrimonas senticii TaxID=394566 RepID=UPI0004125848|nr:hypothetical protein [Ferrimonas senticii]